MNNNEPPPLELRLLTLLQKVRDEHDTDARAELNALLRTDADARKTMANDQALISHLRDESIVSILKPEPSAAMLAKPFRWLAWRPLAAAAAGIVLGIFCTSMVFAYVAPSLGKVIMLLQESFESGTAPLVTGGAVEPGQWSGDYTEVVGEQQGVVPESGKKMLRFLRADFEGKPEPEGSRSADLYRLIDMRPCRDQFADGAAVVQLSAGLNTFESPADERYECSLTLYALDAESVKNGATRSGINLDEAPLGSHKRRIILDPSPATWQRPTSELRLPPDTDFLMVRIGLQYAAKSSSRQTFAGHYLDDVRLTITRLNPPL